MYNFLPFLEPIIGFLWSIFSWLGVYATTPIGVISSNGFYHSATNPFTDYVFDGVSAIPADSIFYDLLDLIGNFLGFDTSTFTVLQFMFITIVSVFLIAVVIRFVSLFIPSND